MLDCRQPVTAEAAEETGAFANTPYLIMFFHLKILRKGSFKIQKTMLLRPDTLAFREYVIIYRMYQRDGSYI